MITHLAHFGYKLLGNVVKFSMQAFAYSNPILALLYLLTLYQKPWAVGSFPQFAIIF